MTLRKYVLSVLAAALCSGPVLANVMTDYLVGTRGGNKLPYKLSLPDDYKNNKDKYPAIRRVVPDRSPMPRP